MGRPRKATETPAAAEPAEAVGVSTFVLTKNHGMHVGKRHAFYPAGAEFSPKNDAALIHQLIQSGARLQEKRAAAPEVEQEPEDPTE